MTHSQGRYTHGQAARFLGIGRNTLTRHRAAGRIGYVIDGAKIFYLAEHLDAYRLGMPVPTIEQIRERSNGISVQR